MIRALTAVTAATLIAGTAPASAQQPDGGMLLAPPRPGATGTLLNGRTLAAGYLVLDADISPDGKTVAFSGHRTGDWNVDIFTVPVNGGNPTRITTHDAWDDNPAWSPDGTQIAYSTGLLDEQPFRDIAIVKSTGGTPRYVTDASAALSGACPVGHRINRPVWFSDGKRLLVSDQCDAGWPNVTTTNSTQIISVATGATLSTITGVWDADLSPNGREIAGVTYANGTSGATTVIARYTIDGRRITNVTAAKKGLGQYDPIYSPRGNRIAYRKAVGADSTAWTVGINGGTRRNVDGTARVLDWR
ncbi:hypothetical protein [Nostocoides vanveenii]|uniref:WD40 repeat protein n=1 Tax=Nostocoides vanveenii TaxID=330835 RepID=A0ABP4WFX6_9MICO